MLFFLFLDQLYKQIKTKVNSRKKKVPAGNFSDFPYSIHHDTLISTHGLIYRLYLSPDSEGDFWKIRRKKIWIISPDRIHERRRIHNQSYRRDQTPFDGQKTSTGDCPDILSEWRDADEMFFRHPKKIRKNIFRHRIEYVMFKQKRHEHLMRQCIIKRQKNDVSNHQETLMSNEATI